MKCVDRKFVSMVLYQAWCGDSRGTPKDIYDKAWCLRDVELDEWRKLLSHLVANSLVEESGEPGYYKLTSKGEDVSHGGNYDPVDVSVTGGAA